MVAVLAAVVAAVSVLPAAVAAVSVLAAAAPLLLRLLPGPRALPPSWPLRGPRPCAAMVATLQLAQAQAPANNRN